MKPGTRSFIRFAVACVLFAGLSTGTLRAALVAHWSFDSAATLGTDSVGSTVLSANGGAAFTPSGKFGGGLALNGSSQFLFGTVNNLPIGNSPYSQTAWIKPTTVGARGIVGWGSYGSIRQVNAFRFFSSGNGLINYWWGADLNSGTAVNFLDGNWHHVAATYNGTQRRIYVDGLLIGGDVPGVANITAANFRIGCTNNTELFHGTLDDVGIYNHALTSDDVLALAMVPPTFTMTMTNPVGGVSDGVNFTVGTVGSTPGANNWAATEAPGNALDNNLATRYRNFRRTNTGFIATPQGMQAGLVVNRLSFTTANDVEGRDPASYRLYGSSTTLSNATPGTNYPIASMTLIATGNLFLPIERGTGPITISIPNGTAYASYLLVFPTTKRRYR